MCMMTNYSHESVVTGGAGVVVFIECQSMKSSRRHSDLCVLRNFLLIHSPEGTHYSAHFFLYNHIKAIMLRVRGPIVI